MRLLLIALCLLTASDCYAYILPSTAPGGVASQDVVAVSDDNNAVGTSGNRWAEGYFGRMRYAEKDLTSSKPTFSDIASFGTVFVSLDHKPYFRTTSGGVLKLYRSSDN